jgi:hypothetical protein
VTIRSWISRRSQVVPAGFDIDVVDALIRDAEFLDPQSAIGGATFAGRLLKEVYDEW